MINVVDRSETHLVQKVSHPNGKVIRYQVFPKDDVGNSSKAWPFNTLNEARLFIGKGRILETTSPDGAFTEQVAAA